MAQQTAVDWLVEQLLDGKLLMPSLIQQAKSMEKEQIEKAFDTEWLKIIRTGEQYYNQTFKNK